jgi:hypothetical protein
VLESARFCELCLPLSAQSALPFLPPVVGPLASELELLDESRQFPDFDLEPCAMRVRSPFDCAAELELEALGVDELDGFGADEGDCDDAVEELELLSAGDVLLGVCAEATPNAPSAVAATNKVHGFMMHLY